MAIVFLATLDLIQEMGPKIKFREDVWCEALTPKEVFPSLYDIASVKEASIVVNMDLWSGSLQRNVSFSRLVHNWEVEVLASFYTLLYSHRMRREGEDQIWWAPSCKGKFEVKSFYNILTFKKVNHFP